MARPLNGIIAFISVFLGALLTSEGIFPFANVLKTGIAALLILSAGNAMNDYCDVMIDMINKPTRPIPSGRISKGEALVFSSLLISIGIGMGAWVNRIALLISIFVTICLVLYAIKLKPTPLAGNILVALLTATTFLAGGVAVGKIRGVIVPAVFAFFFTVAREIVKDIEDVEGDKKVGANTAPIRWGEKRAIYLAACFVGLGVAFSPIPYLLRLYSWVYLLCVTLGVDIVLSLCMLSLWRDQSKENISKVQRIMKLDIFVGLASVYVGRL